MSSEKLDMIKYYILKIKIILCRPSIVKLSGINPYQILYIISKEEIKTMIHILPRVNYSLPIILEFLGNFR